jgi:hypothetical protein
MNSNVMTGHTNHVVELARVVGTLERVAAQLSPPEYHVLQGAVTTLRELEDELRGPGEDPFARSSDETPWGGTKAETIPGQHLEPDLVLDDPGLATPGQAAEAYEREVEKARARLLREEARLEELKAERDKITPTTHYEHMVVEGLDGLILNAEEDRIPAARKALDLQSKAKDSHRAVLRVEEIDRVVSAKFGLDPNHLPF